ncbi:aKG-HExxH-type peptide beta-hydroxylase [Streptomyces sp. NPDC094466]|uniref:aKG-HExxH-type peptide beta-hydroxylase n=1 Tax=Streptomyces sp. NPDC094466 TaxID=3366065 RepID=UPI00381880B7
MPGGNAISALGPGTFTSGTAYIERLFVLSEELVARAASLSPERTADHGTDGTGASPPSYGVVPVALPERRVERERLRGREGLVTRLVRSIEQRVRGDLDVPGVWVLNGLGGSGKTTVALETAHRVSRTVEHVWWVSGGGREDVSEAMLAVAFAVGARPAEFRRVNPADVTWRHLDQLREPWLLVLDNVDDPAALLTSKGSAADGVGWLRSPRHGHGTVLVTSRESRRERWGSWVEDVPVEPLGHEDGARVLLDLAPHAGSTVAARALAEELGSLPLALDLAGSYLARTRAKLWHAEGTPRTFDTYRRAFAEQLGAMAYDPDTSLAPSERARRAILTTWEFSLDLLRRESGTDDARHLLRLLACFGPAPVPHRLLDIGLLAGSGLFENAADGERVENTLRGLAGLRLVDIEDADPGEGEASDEDGERTGAGEDDKDGEDRYGGYRDYREDADEAAQDLGRNIRMHPLVRASNRAHDDFAPRAGTHLRLLVELLNRATGPLRPHEPAHWARWRVLASHCAAPLSLLPLLHPEESGPGTVLAAGEPLLRAVAYRNYRGLYAEALQELDALTTVRSARLGEDDPGTIEARLAGVWPLRGLGRLHEAEAVCRDLSASCDRVLPADHALSQSVRSSRARVLRELGRYAEAEGELRGVLRLRLADPTTDPAKVLRSRHDLASLLHESGRLDEAVDELRGMWDNRSRPGGFDATVLSIGITLAAALRDSGRPEEARSIAGEVVDGCRRATDEDHPLLLSARHEHARTVRDLGQLERAGNEFAEVHQLYAHGFGPEHHNTLAARHELATVLHLSGRHTEAREHLRAVLDINGRRLGEDHPDVNVCRDNLALVLRETTEAEPEPGTAEGLVDLSGFSLGEALSLNLSSRQATDAVTRFGGPRQSRSAAQPPGGGYSRVFPTFTRRAKSRPEAAHAPAPAPPPAPAPTRTATSSHTLSPAALRALATGQEDPALIDRLRSGQRSTRLLVLRELLRPGAFPRAPGDALPPVDEVRDLLEEADHADRHEVDALLLHPSVGRWMSHMLRRRAGEHSPADPSLWTDLGHVHALAVAAGIRAGLRFRFRVPVREGRAFLPTLGHAELGTPDARTAEIIVKRRSVQFPGAGISVPKPLSRQAPGWYPAHHLGAGTGDGALNVLLDDADPFRHADAAPAPAPHHPLDPAAAGRWAGLLTGAQSLLWRTDRQRTRALGAALTALTPHGPADTDVVSHTSSDAFGGIVLSEPACAEDLAVTLVHEFRHMTLNAVTDLVPLLTRAPAGAAEDEVFQAPWRDDARDVEGAFHGVFAHSGVVDFWRRVCRDAEGPLLRRAQFELAHGWPQVYDTFDVLRASPRLTPAGRRFLALAAGSADRPPELLDVPDDVALLAREAVIGNRTRWRIHHLRATPAEVADCVTAWQAGSPLPAHAGTAPLLAPGPTVPATGPATALLRRVAVGTAPAGDPLDAVPGDGDESVGVRTALARTRGDAALARRLCTDRIADAPQDSEAWIGLGLALRRANRETPPDIAAARALSHRPELIRAIHASLTTGLGQTVDPVALAAWSARPTDTEIPGIHRTRRERDTAPAPPPT